MVITPEESIHSGIPYDELSAYETRAAYDIELQRINFDFELINGTASDVAFDACVLDTHLVRAVLSGADLIVERSIGAAWDTVHTIVGGAASIPFALWGFETDVRLWYYDGDIKYKDSANSGVTWGSEQTLDTLADVTHLAPTEQDVLHVVAWIDNRNQHLYRYDGAVQTESDIYFPAPFSGFDAVALSGGINVLTYVALGQVRYDTARQGCWSQRQHNDRWSDPRELDILDEYILDVYERANMMLSTMGGRLFATYQATDSEYISSCFSASSEGRFWQHRQPLGAIDVPGKLLLLGDYVYFVGAGQMYRSASTVLSLHSTVNHNVTDRVVSYTASRQKMHQSAIPLHNEDDSLDYLLDFDRWQIVEQVGYHRINSVLVLLQTIALTEVDVFGHKEDLPEDYLVLTSRDRLAWMADRTEADHYEEWESQLRHWDSFINSINETDQKEILYTGLAHTATMRGRWDTQDEELRLASTNKEGLALCSIDKFIGHTIVQEAVMVQTVDNNEYVGVVVRARDEDNFWMAYYDQATDTIKLRKMESGSWKTPVATTLALSWTTQVWYWIRVEVRLSKFLVYYSTDGLTWVEGFEHIDSDFGNEIGPFREGYVGHAGYGFSDEDVEPPEPPPYVPDNPAPGTGTPGAEQWIFGTEEDVEGVFVTDDIRAVSPVYWDWSEGLTVSGAKISNDLKIDERINPFVIWDCTNCGIYKRELPPRPGVGEWELTRTGSELATAAGIASFDWARVDKMILSIEYAEWSWVHWYAFKDVNTTVNNVWYGIAHTRDNWETIHFSTILDSKIERTHAATYEGGVSVEQHSAGQQVWGSGYQTIVGRDPAGGLYKSNNAGSSFSVVESKDSSMLSVLGRLAIYIPYHSETWNDSYIYWFDKWTAYLRQSTDGGVTFSDIQYLPNVISIAGPTYDKDRISVNDSGQLYEWTTAGGLAAFGLSWGHGIDYGYSAASFVMQRNEAQAVTEWLWAGSRGSPRTDKIWIEDGTDRHDKQGNWSTIANNVNITTISRYQYYDLQVYP